MTTKAPTNKAITKTHIVIPARFQSSRLPGKPLLDIHGKPMILWVAQKAQMADFADDLCIATDDDRIASVCRNFGFDVVMTKDSHATGTDRLAEVAAIKGWSDNDIVINMQGDEPLVPPLLLAQVQSLLINDNDSVMATLYEPIADKDSFLRPSVVKVVKASIHQNERALYFSRAPIPCNRDDIMGLKPAETVPKNAYRHLGLYAYRVSLLKQFVTWEQTPLETLESLEQLRILEYGGQIAIAQAKKQLPAGVDTAEDLARLNAMPLAEFLSFVQEK